MTGAARAEELANINGVSITTEQFMKQLSSIPPQMRSQFEGYEGKKKLLDYMIEEEILAMEGKKQGLENDPAVLAEIEKVKKQAVAQAMAQKIVKEKGTEEGLKAFYEKNAKDFKLIRASHILVNTEEEAKKIKKDLSGGASFEKLAKEKSIDKGSAEKGGDLDYFSKDRMVKAFSDEAFKLKVNEMGGPVHTKFGYHIIKVTDIKTPKYEELTQENKNNIINELVQKEVGQIRSKGNVKVSDENLKKLN